MQLDLSDKANYRPVSILYLVSKVFEKHYAWPKRYAYIEHILNKLLGGLRKVHSTQHAVFILLQQWQSELDLEGFVSTILMDLSKACDCLPHNLLIAMLEGYGLYCNSVTFLLNYLTSRKQRTKKATIGPRFFGEYHNSQSLLLLNVFISDIFSFLLKN